MGEITNISWCDRQGRSLGALKRVASWAGVSAQDYLRRVERGEWFCTSCKTWKLLAEYYSDRSRPNGKSAKCKSCQSAMGKAKYTPRPRTPKIVCYPPGGNKRSAQTRVNQRVADGRLPHPNDLPCTDCGHVWGPGERRHEYDHHKGYSAEHALNVEPVCTRCHHRLGRARGTHVRKRGANGRFING